VSRIAAAIVAAIREENVRSAPNRVVTPPKRAPSGPRERDSIASARRCATDGCRCWCVCGLTVALSGKVSQPINSVDSAVFSVQACT
jgi:hypothetical protein